MAKLKLTAEPTFVAKVPVPIAGTDAPSVEVSMTFRHRTKTDLDAWVKTRDNRSDLESFLEMVVGWELEEEFNSDSAKQLLENYIGTGLATFLVYMEQLVKAKAKN